MKKILKINRNFLITAVLMILIFAGFLIYDFSGKSSNQSPPLISRNQNKVVQIGKEISGCEVEEKQLKVRGDSLSGFIEDGTEMKVLMGYYMCNSVKRGDLVLYNYAGNKNLLIKIVKGIPGDKFQLKKTLADCWNILINGEISKNFQNEPYCFSEQGYKMLSLYEKDYKGVIPPDAYLIFGNSTGGSLDSSRFGLINKQDLIGKAVSG